jgi:glucosamine--fructose-6-phosphate aminotransferase (isomerizing)
MCGIFGFAVNKKSNINRSDLENVFRKLALYSESRGKDSSGLAFLNNQEKNLTVLKGNLRIKKLIDLSKSKELIQNTFYDSESISNNLLCFGHARLVTDGSQLMEFNNQPVIKDNIVTVHNGIIVNAEQLWSRHNELVRQYQIDTEIINAILNKNLNSHNSLFNAVNNSFGELKGTFSIASYFAKFNSLLLSTNNGSLYYLTDSKNFLLFASEEYYLRKIQKNSSLNSIFANYNIEQLKPENKFWINLSDFSIKNISDKLILDKSEKISIEKINIEARNESRELVIDPMNFINRSKELNMFSQLQYNIESIKQLKRCNICILPETFPFISFDEKGTCNYCKNYKKKEYPKDLSGLLELVKPYRKPGKKQDCIVPFSGGRDSTYALHIIKNELDLNPITLTYDWGMVTDLARRNIARACGELGVENVIVSANIHWKRENIRKNVEAWLKNPVLGMIPLFMAGDKYFFYYTNELKKQTGIDLNIWGINHLENTDFKVGFAGISPQFEKERIYSISTINKMKLFNFFSNNIIKNPSYINQSIYDSIGSFVVRYLNSKKDYFHLFDYYRWNENEINNLLTQKYGWEKAIDTNSTWRIGDGTASFYNYIYYTVAGFSEFDTFRSNQIREGMISRQQALNLVNEENKPRYETLRWYLEIIGVDYFHTIKTINGIKKMY